MTARHQERRYERGYARVLLRIARQDYDTAEFSRRGLDQGVRPENVFFLYQQSIEKTLKAVLCFREIPVPLVHDLGILIAKVPESVAPPFGYEITALNDFAGVRRYEEGALIYEEEDVAEASTLCSETLVWAESVILSADDSPSEA
jgi:HEPN domain-containing protein